jgi:hypothetical protein
MLGRALNQAPRSKAGNAIDRNSVKNIALLTREDKRITRMRLHPNSHTICAYQNM